MMQEEKPRQSEARLKHFIRRLKNRVAVLRSFMIHRVQIHNAYPALLPAIAALLPSLAVYLPADKKLFPAWAGFSLSIMILAFLLALRWRLPGLKILALVLFLASFAQVFYRETASLNLPRASQTGVYRFKLKRKLSESEKNISFLADTGGALVLLRIEKSKAAELCGKEVISAVTDFHELEPASNPGGYDEKSRFQRMGVYRKAKIKNYNLLQKAALHHRLAHKAAKATRKRLLAGGDNSADQTFSKAATRVDRRKTRGAFIASGIFTGNKAGVLPAEKAVMQRAGFSHLLAVSGMHLEFLLRPFELYADKRKFSRAGKFYFTVLPIPFFALFTYSPASLLRAGLLKFLNSYCVYRKISYSGFNNALWGLAIFAALSPERIIDAGFCYSYAASAAIIIFAEGLADKAAEFLNDAYYILKNLPYYDIRKEMRFYDFKYLDYRHKDANSLINYFKGDGVDHYRENKISARQLRAAATAFAAQTAIALPALLFAGEVNFTSILTSIPAGILTEFTFLTTAFTCLISFAATAVAGLSGLSLLPIAKIGRLLARFLNLLAEAALAIAGAFAEILYVFALKCSYIKVFRLSKSSVLFLFAAAFLIFVFMRRKHLKRKILLLITISYCLLIIWPGSYRFVMLDVGQGDAAVFYNRKKAYLFDGGEPEAAYNVLLPFMRDQGIKEFDAAFVSHGHSDHAGGIYELMKAKLIKEVVYPDMAAFQAGFKEGDYDTEDFIEAARSTNSAYSPAAKGDYFKLSPKFGKYDYELEVLSPSPDLLKRTRDLNDSSLLIRLDFAGLKILITGDVAEKAESAALNQDLKSEVYIAAHHGSKTSSSERFLKEINPQISLISAGKYNKYGHPAGEVIARLENYGPILRSDRDGAVIIRKLNGQEFLIESFKSEKRFICELGRE